MLSTRRILLTLERGLLLPGETAEQRLSSSSLHSESSRNNSETSPAASGIGPIQQPVIKRLIEERTRAMRRGAFTPNHTESGTTAMHGKTSKFASTMLSALLYTQGLLGIAGVTLVVLKDRTHSDPAYVVGSVSADAQVR